MESNLIPCSGGWTSCGSSRTLEAMCGGVGTGVNYTSLSPINGMSNRVWRRSCCKVFVEWKVVLMAGGNRACLVASEVYITVYRGGDGGSQ